MKQEYQHLKLIIECYTLEQQTKVRDFFGAELMCWGEVFVTKIPSTGLPSFFVLSGLMAYKNAFEGYEHLTYPEFEARFLNKKDMKDEEEFSIDVPEDLTDYYLCEYGITGRSLSQGHDTSGYIANIPLILPGENYEILRKEGSKLFIKLKQPPMNIENIINKAVEGLEQAASTLSKVQEMLKNRSEPEPEKKVWTVEEVQKDVKPKWVFFSDGKICESRFGNYLGSCPTEKAAQQVLAFCQLLTVAHWANEGSSSPNGGDYYSVHWSGNGFPAIYVPNNHEHVLIFKSRYAYEKFASVHGVEDLLKTFFGIEE